MDSKIHLRVYKSTSLDRNPGGQDVQATIFSTTVSGSSVWNLPHGTLLTPRILRWPLDIFKICEPLFYHILGLKINVIPLRYCNEEIQRKRWKPSITTSFTLTRNMFRFKYKVPEYQIKAILRTILIHCSCQYTRCNSSHLKPLKSILFYLHLISIKTGRGETNYTKL
jgi:hypothetical protein